MQTESTCKRLLTEFGISGLEWLDTLAILLDLEVGAREGIEINGRKRVSLLQAMQYLDLDTIFSNMLHNECYNQMLTGVFV